MHKLLANKYFYLWISLAICVGIAIGLPFNLESYTLKFEIDFIGLCEIIVTILLALFITNALEKKVQDNRFEKELYISQIRKIEEFSIELKNSLNSSEISYPLVTGIIARCRIKKNKTLKSVSEQFELNCDKTFIQISSEMSASLKSIKTLMTNTDVGKKNEVIMRNNLLKFSSKRKSLIFKELDKFEDELFKLIVLINSL